MPIKSWFFEKVYLIMTVQILRILLDLRDLRLLMDLYLHINPHIWQKRNRLELISLFMRMYVQNISTGRRRPDWALLLVDIDHWAILLVDVDHPDVSGQCWTATVDAVDAVGVNFTDVFITPEINGKMFLKICSKNWLHKPKKV